MNEELNQTEQSAQSAIGEKFQSAREALGMDRKDVASQLRLHEKVITMLEKDTFNNDLPTIFIRGYIRAYGKFLQLPDYEIKAALEPITPITPTVEVTPPAEEEKSKLNIKLPSKKIMMQIATSAIAITVLGLVWSWWHSHNNASIKIAEKNLAIPVNLSTPIPTKQTVTIPLASKIKAAGNANPAQKLKIPFANPAIKSAPVVATAPVAKQKIVTAAVTKKTEDDEYYDEDEFEEVE